MSDPNVTANTPAASETPATPVATPTPVASAQVGSPATPIAPANTPAPAISGQPPQGYVPSHVLRERTAQYEARMAQAEAVNTAKIEQLTRQLQALTGVTPQNVSEEETIRQQLFKVVPDLQKLIAMREQLETMSASRDEIVNQNQHYWQSYNRTQMDRLYKNFETNYGQPLSDSQRNYIKAAFVGWASNDPDLAERYQTDPTLVDEFAKEFSSNFVEPARRQATSATAARVPANLPQDSPSGALRSTPVPEGPKDLDATVDKAWAQFKQLRQKG